MKVRHVNALVLLLASLGASSVSFAACDQTLSAGANVASAISGAAAGTTICLNSGSYGTVNITNVVKSGDVTVQSASGRTATLYVKIYQSNHIRLQNLTLTGFEIDTNQQGGTKNITISANTFTGQMVINAGNNGSANILIDGNTFDKISVCANCYEGRLQVIANPWSTQLSGITITNNHFGGPGESDGIQNGANGVIIGPGNVFDGIVQDGYSRHVDAYQGYGQANTTVTGNYFLNGDTYIMTPDGGHNEMITNNIFVGSGYRQKVQLGAYQGGSFSHNTVIGIDVASGAKSGQTPNSGTSYLNNIFIGGAMVDSGDQPGCNSGCVYDHNLFASSSYARGTSPIIGTPTFVGGANPSSWAGFQLTSNSLGYRAGSDGKDVGTNYYGPSTSTTSLAAPSNLRVVK